MLSCEMKYGIYSSTETVEIDDRIDLFSKFIDLDDHPLSID